MSIKEKNELLTQPSEPEAVDAWMKTCKHPLKSLVTELRNIFLAADQSVGETIAWNAPCFFYTGKLNPFPPKEYKRVLVVFNFYRNDCIRLIFLRGALAKDPKGLLEGDYKDGRRLMQFSNLAGVKSSEKAIQAIIRSLIKAIDKK